MFFVFLQTMSGVRRRHAGVDWSLLRVVATSHTNAPATGLEDSWRIRARRATRVQPSLQQGMFDKVLPVWVDTFEMAAATLIAAIDTVVNFHEGMPPSLLGRAATRSLALRD